MEPSNNKVSALSINLSQDPPTDSTSGDQKELDRLQQEWFS